MKKYILNFRKEKNLQMVSSTWLARKSRDNFVGVLDFLEHPFHKILNFIKAFWKHAEQSISTDLPIWTILFT